MGAWVYQPFPSFLHFFEGRVASPAQVSYDCSTASQGSNRATSKPTTHRELQAQGARWLHCLDCNSHIVQNHSDICANRRAVHWAVDAAERASFKALLHIWAQPHCRQSIRFNGIMNIFYLKSLEALTVRRSQSVETFFGRLDRTGWFDHACPLRSSCVQSFRKILNDRSQSQTSILSDCPPQHRASKHAMVLHAQGAFRPIPLQRPDPWIHGTLWQQAVLQPVQLHLSHIVSRERPLVLRKWSQWQVAKVIWKLLLTEGMVERRIDKTGCQL